MRAPSHAIDHHRNRPALEPIRHRATKRRCFCEMLVAATTDPRRAALACMTLLVVSDRRPEVPCTKRGQIDRAHQASLESATLRSLSERLTLVTAVTGILLRHGCKIPNVPPNLQHFYLGAFGLNRHWGTTSSRKVLQSQLRGNTGVSSRRL